MNHRKRMILVRLGCKMGNWKNKDRSRETTIRVRFISTVVAERSLLTTLQRNPFNQCKL